MSLPDGVTTCLLTYGPITDTFGNTADSITVEVVADRTIVHGASGRTLFKSPVAVVAAPGGVAQLPVPHTNQSGFRDQQQNPLTGWYYTVKLTARFAGGSIETDTKTFQPLVGQTTVDADLLPSDGMVTPGVTTTTAVVTSVAGQTGEVTADQIAEAVSGGILPLVAKAIAGDPDFEDGPNDAVYSVAYDVASNQVLQAFNPNEVGYDVWLLAGQSNMAGRGMAYDAAVFDPQSTRIQQYPAVGTYAGQIVQASEPLGFPDSIALAPIGMGPGLVFGRWLQQSIPDNRRILLVPAAYGGSGFSVSYPLTWDTTAATGSLYKNAIAQANAAIAAAGPNVRFAGILWLQGEQDSSMSTSAYAAKLDALIAGFRSSITGASSSTPFVLGRMAPGYVNINSGSRGIEAAHIDTPSRVAYTAVAPSPSGYDDTLHFTAPGERIIGRDMFYAYLTAKAASSVAPLTAPAAPTGLAIATTTTGATLSWTPQGRTASYKVEQSTNGGSSWTTLAATVYGNTYALTGLTAASYVFRVTGVNAAGTGTGATISTTFSTPGQVTGLTSPSQTSTGVTLSWTAVTVGSQPVSYLVESSSDGGTVWTTFSTVTTTTATVTGLTASTSYKFRVTAKSAGISGTASSVLTQATVTPVNVTDNFTRADSSSSLGGSWTALRGTWGIRSNTAYLVTDASGGAGPYNTASLAIGASDGTVSLDITGTAIDTGAAGLAFRISDASNYLAIRVGGNVAQFYRMVGGAIQTVNGSIAFTHSSSGTVTISVVLAGSSVIIKGNGTTIGTFTETFNQSATGHGLWGLNVSANTSLDNFSFVG